MLQAINDRIKGWLGISIVVIIGLPFALWGIQSYVSDGPSRYAAKIDDIEISPQELQYNVSIQKQRLQQQNQGQLDIDEEQLKQQVLEQLINRKLVEMVSYQYGYRISDKELSDNIKELFSSDGEFSRLMYDSVRQSQNKNERQFEEDIRSEMRVIQMRDGIVNSGIGIMSEARRLTEIESQTREPILITFNIDENLSNVSVSEDEIRQAYEQESVRYMNPEKVSIQYIELTSESKDAKIQVNEKDVKDLYEQYVANLAQKERRKASHILLKVGANKQATIDKLEDIRKQIESGASFGEMAQKFSEDTVSAKDGGDLGWVEHGQMIEAFEKALFALDKGEISSVVESQYGLHLIRLNDVQREAIESLADKRKELEAILRNEMANNEFYELSENLAATAYENPDSLDAAADLVGVKLQKSDLFTRDEGKGIAEKAVIRAAAFSKEVLEQGNNSEVIELTPEHLIVLRVNERILPSPKPLDEVKNDIENRLKLRKAHEATLSAALEARQKILSGEKIENAVPKKQMITRPGAVKRNEVSRLDPNVLATLFKLSPIDESNVDVRDVVLNSGDVVLVMLEKINKPETINQGRAVTVKRQLKQETAAREFMTLLKAFRDSVSVSQNTKSL